MQSKFEMHCDPSPTEGYPRCFSWTPKSSNCINFSQLQCLNCETITVCSLCVCSLWEVGFVRIDVTLYPCRQSMDKACNAISCRKACFLLPQYSRLLWRIYASRPSMNTLLRAHFSYTSPHESISTPTLQHTRTASCLTAARSA